MRTPLIIALTATLAGCSSQPLRQEIAGPSPDKDRLACAVPTVAARPVQLASPRISHPVKKTRVTSAAKTKKQSSHRTHLATGKAKHAIVAAKAKVKPSVKRSPVRPASPSTPTEPKSNASAGLTTTGQNIAASHPIADPVPSSNGTRAREQVLAAMAVAERLTAASGATARDGTGPIADASRNNVDPLVAVVMVRPDIGSVSDLFGKTVAIDDRYSASGIDVKIAIVAAGGPMVRLSAGRMAAMDRLFSGEMSAAVLGLVSADAAESFPEIAGFRILRVPLLRPPP